jgi:hypothetical protein
LRDFIVVDRRDTLFLALPRECARALRDLATDFLVGRRLRVPFEIALDLFTILRTVPFAAGATGRLFSAAFPATAPIIPPTTAPIGPAARLPTAAPVTAPAVCFGIGGILMSADDCKRWFFFSRLDWLGIDGGRPQIFNSLAKVFA